jgi:hypothetical protein
VVIGSSSESSSPHGTGTDQTVDDWPEPVCGPGEVIVETHGVGLCGSDTAAMTELPDARPGAVVEARFPLARAQEAFAGAAGRAGKTWIDLGSAYA